MDKDLKAQLEDQLYERISHENEAYLAELRTKTADEIINSAYQIACRENILYLFEEETQLNVRQLQVLMEMSSPLRELYEDWCGRDSNEMELLRGSIEDSTSGILNHRAEIRYSDPKTPIYEKTYTEAREQNELYEWKADHLQSYHCNRMFAQKAEGAHHCNAFHPFLQEWTEKYGLERCMFVLSCSIAQREGDGRFYPPARQATARFAHYRKRHEGFEISNYTNNVHSGVINLAMEGLLKMERERDGVKPKNHVKNQTVR